MTVTLYILLYIVTGLIYFSSNYQDRYEPLCDLLRHALIWNLSEDQLTEQCKENGISLFRNPLDLVFVPIIFVAIVVTVLRSF